MAVKTIWHERGLPHVPAKWRPVYRYVLPVTDLSLIVFGVASFFAGSKIVEDFALPWFRPVWACMILVGALVSLPALGFCRKRIELFGRFAVLLGLGVYVAATIAYIADGNDTAILTLAITAAVVTALIWRETDVIDDIGREEANRAVLSRGKDAGSSC